MPMPRRELPLNSFLQATGVRRMPGCREYWLIDCECVKAEHWTRTDVNEWRLHSIEDINAMFARESLGIEVPLARLYFGAIFGELSDARPPSS